MNKFIKSFGYAFSGISEAIKTQRNLRFHIVAVLYVSLTAVITNVSKTDWIAILICFALVLSSEMFNTAVEKLCDTLHPEKSEKLKFVKDVSAGAVLISAIISAIVGAIIFFDRETLQIAADFIKNNVVLTIVIVCTLVPAIMFVSGRKKNDN